jgi:hypothetical protein
MWEHKCSVVSGALGAKWHSGMSKVQRTRRCSARVDMPSSPMAWVIKSKALFSLRKDLSDTVTEPDISRLLMAWLTAWVMNTRCYPQRTQVEGIQRALESQDLIGWMSLIEGCVSWYWTEAQDDYYNKIGSQWSGCCWTINLNKKCLTWHGICGKTKMLLTMTKKTKKNFIVWGMWILIYAYYSNKGQAHHQRGSSTYLQVQ